MNKVSLIIPVYNVEKYLRRCLDSVLNQTCPDWEAVCVNDGSPDGSRAILAEYASRDNRFKIVDKPNGGLSDARNEGMKNASGEYIIYLDSDDFIHPQTVEIALALAERNGTDIVSWYKAPNYRNITVIRHKLGLDTIDFRPRGFRKRFDAGKVRCCVSNDIYEHVTEWSHPKGITWPLKHFYVWRHLIRKSVIEDIQFIKGITFEDFPWWSAVLLKNPSVTITYLPFYYYYPNFGSIDLSSSRIKKVTNWCIGLEQSHDLYTERGNDYQKEMWSRNCKWPTIYKHIARKIRHFNPKSPECAGIVERLSGMMAKGTFDDPHTKQDKKTRRIIADFLSESLTSLKR